VCGSVNVHCTYEVDSWIHRTDRQRSPSSYGDRILGSNRKYFAAMGSESLAPLSKLNYKFNYV